MPPAPPPSLIAAVTAQLDAAGIALPSEAPERLAGFLDALLRANRLLNLTRDDTLPGAAVRHVLEPIAAWMALEAAFPTAARGALVDVGPGGGAPGLPIAIARPELPVTLVESRERKAGYLRETAAELSLANVRVLHRRAEQYGREEGRERFSVALTRALAAGPIAFEVLLPLVNAGGVAAIIAGPAAATWLSAASTTAADLGGDPPSLIDVRWPGGDRDVRLACSRKRGPTPDRFPRDLRRIKKDPRRRAGAA